MAKVKVKDIDFTTGVNGPRQPVVTDGAGKLPQVDGSALTNLLSVIRTGLLAEYRFDEGTGTVVNDYSGNGNVGTYVGSPTLFAEGGFTAANGKYATGSPAFLTSAQTIYIVADVDNDNLNTYHAILGNSGGLANLNIAQSNMNNGSRYPGVNLVGNNGNAGTQAFDIAPATPYIIACTIDASNVEVGRVFINGKECTKYASQNLGLASSRLGTPYFGQTNQGGVGFLDGNIYYAASYSTKHTPAQIRANYEAIRRLLGARGNIQPKSFNENSTVNQLLGIGDSITYGQGSSSWTSLLSGTAATTETFTKWNKGFPGINTTELLASAFGFASLYFCPIATNIVTILAGTNNIGSITAAQTLVEIRAIATIFKKAGWKVIVCTLIDRGDTLGTTNASFYTTLNPAIRNTYKRFADELADLQGNANIGTVGASSNTTYFQGDKVHPTDAGEQIIANIVAAAINRITDANPL